MTKRHKPGTVADGRIGIFDAAGNCRGHCGPYATEATVTHHFGVANPVLKTVKGRLEWHGQAIEQRRRPETRNHAAARGSVKARG